MAQIYLRYIQRNAAQLYGSTSIFRIGIIGKWYDHFSDEHKQAFKDVTGDLLTELGYEVELAKNGIEAIELYKNAKKSSKPFDAIIMDLTIQGGMGGKETIQEIIAFDPKVKAIVSSGYAKDPIMDNFKKYGFIGAIVKPYGVEELSKTLYKIIKNIDKEF